MGHIHAELMAQYAEDAKEHDRPWELWEYDSEGIWKSCADNPAWLPDRTYRHKPRTVKVGDIAVPEPCKTPLVYGQEYFVPNVSTASASSARIWMNNSKDLNALKSKLVHADLQSAALHAKALIEVSKGWWK